MSVWRQIAADILQLVIANKHVEKTRLSGTEYWLNEWEGNMGRDAYRNSTQWCVVRADNRNNNPDYTTL